MQEIAAVCDATLTRLDCRVKSEDSLTRKLIGDPEKPNIARNLRRINDAIRYTFVAHAQDYWAAHDNILSQLSEDGYVVVADPRGWKRTGYRGINLTVRAPDGHQFEVQLHTEASLAVSEATHSLYEEKRVLEPFSHEWTELDVRIAAIYSTVPLPPGVPWLS
ncbi:hypothetical protein [Aeromicrobium sp. 9AM]|uniref:hypothetical protein n=1 Tax=Aeromicrobium sp. 9AM TaxID=2653126 RepID=UPI00135C4320|nr:hypothetical protein [Aeromicrobium sp. 9AM]